MKSEHQDHFTKGILDRLDGVEEGRRLDRDGRNGLIALAVVAVVLLGTISFETLLDRAGGSSSDGVADVAPLVTPASVLEAVDRIQVPATDDSSGVPSGSVETEALPRRYETIEAVAPGRRS